MDSLTVLDISSSVIQININNSIMSINPGVHCLFNHSTPTNSYHMHNCYELCIVTSGKGFYKYGDQVYEIEEGDLFVADPGILHEIAILPEKKQSMGIFYFSFEIVGVDQLSVPSSHDSILKKFLYTHEQVAKGQNQILFMLDFLSQYSQHINRNHMTIQRTIESIILESLDVLSHHFREGNQMEENSLTIIDQALAYISAHLIEKIKIEDIAMYTHTSSRNLQKLFKRSLNMTVKEYIDRRRIHFAMSYLKMNFKVADVGLRIGIDDPSQFSRFFKKYVGRTPKQYQIEYISDGMKYGALFDNMD